MAISLTPQPVGAVIPLHQGFVWADEHSWTPVAQSTEYSLTGALIVESARKQAGRPITLKGGIRFVWVTRSQLLALDAALKADGARFILTLHDGRRWSVIPRHDGDGPIVAAPVPAVLDSGPADPTSNTKYYIDNLRFWALSTTSEP